MPTDPYASLLADLEEALADSGEPRGDFGRKLGWKDDSMVRLFLTGQRDTSLRRVVEWARRTGRHLELVKAGDPISRVVSAIRADADLPPPARKALEASYLAARRQLLEEPPARQRRRAAGES